MSLFLKARRLLVVWKPMLGMAKTFLNALNLGPFGSRLFLLSTAVLYTTPLLRSPTTPSSLLEEVAVSRPTCGHIFSTEKCSIRAPAAKSRSPLGFIGEVSERSHLDSIHEKKKRSGS